MGQPLSDKALQERIEELGPWFHNMDLAGVRTAPDHFLGDYPAVKWRKFANAIPQDLKGKSVLDIGCNGGFYSIEMKRRGADRVLGIDFDDVYLGQARFAAEIAGVEIELAKLSVYDVASLKEQFDIVLFMGVFYHLRHPQLALDLISDHVAKDLMIFQSMLRGSLDVEPVEENHPFSAVSHFEHPAYPKMHFIEHSYADDPTNWWVPNRACTEAMLRSSGFTLIERPEKEVYICRKSASPLGEGAVYPAKG